MDHGLGGWTAEGQRACLGIVLVLLLVASVMVAIARRPEVSEATRQTTRPQLRSRAALEEQGRRVCPGLEGEGLDHLVWVMAGLEIREVLHGHITNEDSMNVVVRVAAWWWQARTRRDPRSALQAFVTGLAELAAWERRYGPVRRRASPDSMTVVEHVLRRWQQRPSDVPWDELAVWLMLVSDPQPNVYLVQQCAEHGRRDGWSSPKARQALQALSLYHPLVHGGGGEGGSAG